MQLRKGDQNFAHVGHISAPTVAQNPDEVKLPLLPIPNGQPFCPVSLKSRPEFGLEHVVMYVVCSFMVREIFKGIPVAATETAACSSLFKDMCL